MTKATQLMSDAKFYESYARYREDLQRYETWNEAVDRVMSMHRTKYADVMTPELDSLITFATDAYNNQHMLGAQRALQFGGDQLLSKNAKLYNCTACYLDSSIKFQQIFWLMLCGCGVGFSVQKHHISSLPSITKRTKSAKTFVVEDSIEGWADAVGALMKSFFVEDSEFAGRKLYFDLTKIRPEGAHISGGFKAPGPEPLRKALDKIEKLIKDELDSGATQLRTIVAYDIVMHIADAVISGGVRRAATICLFSHDDQDMITAKTGSWFVDNPQRGRSNNSAVLLRDSTQFDEFQSIMQSVQHSGEPGFVWTDNLDILFNPCVEISLYGYTDDGRSGFQMCNLAEINGKLSTTPDFFYQQCKAAAILGTLQAGYTDFDYLDGATKEIVEREALIGVGITGWMNNPDVLFNKDVQRKGAETVRYWNRLVADLIGINQAARTTCVKPSGNASVLLGCASGIHGEHAPRYIRHVQMNKQTEVAQMFTKTNPNMVEPSVWNSLDNVIAFPIESPEGSIYKSDLLGTKQLDYVKCAQDNWIEYGTNKDLCVKPFLKHNVSNTITVDDWDSVTNYIYDNRHSLCGVSFLAATGDKAYPQAPFTEVFTEKHIVDKYGTKSMFASGLIERGLKAFNGDLWTACSTALGYGEQLTDSHKDAEKQEFIRSFDKFAVNFMPDHLTSTDYSVYHDIGKDVHRFEVELSDLENKLDAYIDVLDSVNERTDNDPLILELIGLIANVNEAIRTTADSLDDAQTDLKRSAVSQAQQQSKQLCSDCLKDVYNLHKWWKITTSTTDINWATDLPRKDFVAVDTLAAAACNGGSCEIDF